jgi:tetratricopeptide (TPR) repeat protein
VFELKSIAKLSISRALERAERYRLLNEPREAESICLDVLQIEPDNRSALQTLLLALTDQFASHGAGRHMEQAKQILPRLPPYEQKYYAGIIAERFARHQLDAGHPGANSSAYSYLCEAMKYYDEAHELAPEGNDEAILRHNTCVRTIGWHHLVEPLRDEQELPLE